MTRFAAGALSGSPHIQPGTAIRVNTPSATIICTERGEGSGSEQHQLAITIEVNSVTGPEPHTTRRTSRPTQADLRTHRQRQPEPDG